MVFTYYKGRQGKIRVYHEMKDIEKEISIEEWSEYLKLGFRRGRRSLSSEVRKKMSISKLGKKNPINSEKMKQLWSERHATKGAI
jgi:hypothetical protein